MGTKRVTVAMSTIYCFLCLMSFQLEINLGLTQLTFTCSKSTIETLEKGVKYMQS